jgi:hypothetical protein
MICRSAVHISAISIPSIPRSPTAIIRSALRHPAKDLGPKPPVGIHPHQDTDVLQGNAAFCAIAVEALLGAGSGVMERQGGFGGMITLRGLTTLSSGIARASGAAIRPAIVKFPRMKRSSR